METYLPIALGALVVASIAQTFTIALLRSEVKLLRMWTSEKWLLEESTSQAMLSDSWPTSGGPRELG